MPKQTRYNAREERPDDGGRRPRSAAPAGPPVLPLLALVVLIGLAIAAARMYSSSATVEPEEGAPQGYVPFGGVPDEAPPGARTGGGPARAATTDLAPSGLEANPVWQQALALAAKGDAALARASAAREANDSTASQAAAREARDAFDEAVTLTAAWEDELLAKYGETDRQVRQISRTRGLWFKNLTALHKTTGR